MAKGSSIGVVTGQDIINDPLAALLFETLTSRSQGNLIHEQASGGSAVDQIALGSAGESFEE